MNESSKLVAVPLVALGLVVGFVIAHFLFVHQLVSSDRAVVRAELEACRTAYVQKRLAGLRDHIAGESYFERESSFVEVIDADRKLTIFHAPTTQKEVSVLRPLASPNNPVAQQEWIHFPSSETNMDWTITKTTLPDGSVMFVGRMTEDHRLAVN